jgi:hypothetical protein
MMRIVMAAILPLVLASGMKSVSPQNLQKAATTALNDRTGIEKLHQQDIAATFSGDPNALADLFTETAFCWSREPQPLWEDRRF